VVLAGLTGTGKSALLAALSGAGEQVLDLQRLAAHAGSAFGGLGRPPQPSHRVFQAAVTDVLAAADPSRPLWVEDCPAYLGSVGVPLGLQHLIASAPIVTLHRSRRERIEAISTEYGPAGNDTWLAALRAVSPRLGPGRAARASAQLVSGNLEGCVDTLLDYYDHAYRRAHKSLPVRTCLLELHSPRRPDGT